MHMSGGHSKNRHFLHAAVLSCAVQITFKPYACRMLDTLRRLAVFALMATLLTLPETQGHAGLALACMIIMGLINVGIIAVHLWATAREVRRWLLWLAGKGPDDALAFADLKLALPDTFRGQRWLPCGGWCKGGC